MKTALVLPIISPESLEFGGMTTVGKRVLFDNGSVLSYLPQFESQSHTYFDDYGCVSNSFESAIQILIIRQIEELREINRDFIKKEFYLRGEPDFSNRDLIVLSGTVPRVGNSGDRVLKTAQEKGLIPQAMGDWNPFSRDINNIEFEFYSYLRSPASQKIADKWNDRIRITGEWVPRERWAEASKEGVLQIYVNAWNVNKDGKYYNPNGKYNHAVLMADYEGKGIYDSYQPMIKELSSWNDAYYWALKINIEEKSMNKPKLENNSLLQLVEGFGGFGMFLDDKIVVGNTADILASCIMRNGGNLQGKARALTQEQWDMFPKYNLKMEKL